MLCLFLDSSVILAAAGNSQGGSSKILNFALGGEVILLTSDSNYGSGKEGQGKAVPSCFFLFPAHVVLIPY